MKWDYSSVKCLLKKFRKNGATDRRHSSGQPRTVSNEKKKHGFDRRIALSIGRAAPYAFSIKKN